MCWSVGEGGRAWQVVIKRPGIRKDRGLENTEDWKWDKWVTSCECHELSERRLEHNRPAER